MIKYGCHGSTWELDYDKESDNLTSILDDIQNAGFQGIDAQISLLGKYKEQPHQLLQELEIRNLELAALTFPFSWENEEIRMSEFKKAQYYVNFLKKFKGAKLNIAPRVRKDRNDLKQHQYQIIFLANMIAEYAHHHGVTCTFHPSSPAGSMFRTYKDYQYFKEHLDFKYINYTPDSGHILFGNMSPQNIFNEFSCVIKHVHWKDASNYKEWCKMGEGDIGFKKLNDFLLAINYDGWVMVEEETVESSKNPRKAIEDIKNYLNSNNII